MRAWLGPREGAGWQQVGARTQKMQLPLSCHCHAMPCHAMPASHTTTQEPDPAGPVRDAKARAGALTNHHHPRDLIWYYKLITPTYWACFVPSIVCVSLMLVPSNTSKKTRSSRSPCNGNPEPSNTNTREPSKATNGNNYRHVLCCLTWQQAGEMLWPRRKRQGSRQTFFFFFGRRGTHEQ